MDFKKKLYSTILSESFYLLGSILKVRYYVYQLVCPPYRQVYNLLYSTIIRVKHAYSQTLTCLAVCSRETGDTATRVRVDSANARRSISTRTAGTFVDI